jgi:hypothetical protein
MMHVNLAEMKAGLFAMETVQENQATAVFPAQALISIVLSFNITIEYGNYVLLLIRTLPFPELCSQQSQGIVHRMLSPPRRKQ